MNEKKDDAAFGEALAEWTDKFPTVDVEEAKFFFFKGRITRH